MPTAKILTGVVYQNRSAIMLARIVGIDYTGSTVTNEGKQILAADVSALTYSVIDLVTETAVTNHDAVNIYGSIATIITAALQTPAIWTGKVDATGYNFRYDLAVTAFPTAARKYRVEFKFTTTGSIVSTIAFDVQSLKVYMS